MNRRNAQLITLLVLALSAPLGGCDATAKLTEQEHIQRAKDFEDKGNLKGSIVELRNAIQKNPDSPQARLLLGQIYLKVGMGAEAEKELSQAEKLGVNRESTTPQLGEALLLMGEYQRVLDEIQPGEQTSKSNLARILQLRADALLKQGKLKEACNIFQQSVDTDKTNVPTYWGLAQCAAAEQDNAKANEWLKAALQLKDKQAQTWVYVGSLHSRNGNTKDALIAFDKSLKIDPSNLDALAQRISIHLSQGQTDIAQKDLERLTQLAPNSTLANYLKALLSFQQGKFPAAQDALQEIFKTTNSHAPSILLAGATSFAMGSYQQAETHLNRVLASFPNNVYARRVLGATYLRQGQPAKTLDVLSPMLAQGTTDAQALAMAGEAYLRLQEFNKAMDLLERASKLNPENVTIRTNLAAGLIGGGEVERAMFELNQATAMSAEPGKADLLLPTLHLHRKEYDKALVAIQALEQKLPSNPITQNLRAAALLGKKDQAEARIALERAIAIDPTFFPAAMNLARLDIAEKRPDAARKRFESILAHDKTNVQAMMALADLAGIEKKENEAVGWLEKALKVDPKAMAPRASLVRFHLSKGQSDMALAIAREMANMNPDNLEALNLLGATQMSAGNTAASVATYARMVQLAPQSAPMLLNLGIAQLADKQPNPARATLQKALRIKPDFIQAMDTLIRLEVTEKNYTAALKIAHQLQAQLPKQPIGYEREGDILMAQGRYLEASKAFELALARGDNDAVRKKKAQALALGKKGN